MTVRGKFRKGSLHQIRGGPGNPVRRHGWISNVGLLLQMSDDRKRSAALAALEHVEEGMRLGLGTGSTAACFVEALGQRVRDGLAVTGVPTSAQTRDLAIRCRIPLTDLHATPELDLAIDGADEIGPGLGLIKGGGGALLREKIVASASARMIVIADDSKLVERLGEFPLPVEVVPFAGRAIVRSIGRAVSELGLKPRIEQRMGPGGPFVSDEGNHILDISCGPIPDPDILASRLSGLAGVVEHGLFLGMAESAIVAGPDGLVRIEA